MLSGCFIVAIFFYFSWNFQKIFLYLQRIIKNGKMTAIDDALHEKRAELKAKIRQMVGILNEESLDDWKREKETVL